MLKFTVIAVLAGACAINLGCVKEHLNEPVSNRPPKTHFWIYPDSNIAEGVSKQRLHWWGEDEDGYVTAYLFAYVPDLLILPSPDTLSYAFITATDTVVQFPLKQARQTYFVAVRAVDNTFAGIPVNAVVRLSPRPYWDKNGNRSLDAGDVELPELSSAVDPNAARQAFPIRNSPPTVAFQADPSNPSQVIQQPDTTFTVASFSWKGLDPDGDETIASYRVSLNDTSFSSSLTVSSATTLITLIVPRIVSDPASSVVSAQVWSGTFPNMRQLGILTGLKLNGTNVFYLQARDIAGDLSPRAQIPQGTKTWFVKKPKSRLLVVSDYQRFDSVDVRKFYKSVVSGVAGGLFANYDELDIRVGSTASKPGILVPAILNPAFVHTLKLFDCVLWYTDQFPSLAVAQFPLYLYVSTGGKVIYTTEFASAVTDPRGTLTDFAPLDSISSVQLPNPNLSDASRTWPGTTRIPKNYVLQADSSVSSNIYPTLEFDSLNVSNQPTNFHLFFMRPIYRRADARYIYRLQASDAALQPPGLQYGGRPTLGIIDNAKRFVFMGVPLHILNGRLNGGQGAQAFINKVLVGEFGF